MSKTSSIGLPSSMAGKQMLHVHEIADFLRVSRPSVYRWVADGYLRGLRLGTSIRVPVDELVRFLEEAQGE